MSRGRKRKKKRQLQTAAREQHLLHQPLNAMPPYILDILKRMVGANEREYAELALQLEKFLKGDASLLEDRSRSDDLNAARQRAYERDKAADAYATNSVKFVDEVMAKADSLKPTGDALEREKVKGAKIMQDAVKVARGGRSTRQLWLDWQLQHGPKETIAVSGWMETIKQGDSRVTVHRPDRLSILGHKITLNPGVREVPSIVAYYYREMQRSRQEHEARTQAALATKTSRDAGAIERDMVRIDSEYGTSHMTPPGTGG